jgi:predicted peroxiredoxin
MWDAISGLRSERTDKESIMKRSAPWVIVGFATTLLLGCTEPSWEPGPVAEPVEPIMFFSLTRDAEADPHSTTMAMQLAGHSLDAGREVILFFNVRGVTVPTRDFPDDLAFHDKPIAELLRGLIDRGAEVHVCPHCMKALDVQAGDLIPGARVTDRESLFSKLGADTVVFTY